MTTGEAVWWQDLTARKFWIMPARTISPSCPSALSNNTARIAPAAGTFLTLSVWPRNYRENRCDVAALSDVRSHPAHHWGMPTNIPLRYETHIALVEDIIEGTTVAGFDKFICLSAHGQVSDHCRCA